MRSWEGISVFSKKTAERSWRLAGLAFTLACATGIVASVPPAAAAALTAFDALAPVPDRELDQMRASGFDIWVRYDLLHEINGVANTRSLGEWHLGGTGTSSSGELPGNVLLSTTANGGLTQLTTNAGRDFLIHSVRNAADGQVIRSLVVADVNVSGLAGVIRSAVTDTRLFDIARMNGLIRR